MKSLRPKIQILVIALFGIAWLVTINACNEKKSSSESTSFEEKPATSVPSEPIVAKESNSKSEPASTTKSTAKDSLSSILTKSTTPPPTTKTGSGADKTIYPTPAPKDCQPNFKMIGKPKGNHYLFYVTGFNPGEFKCWNLVEEHGVSICNGKPCVIYYVDDPNGSMSAPPPNYVDPKFLKEHGYGQFSHDENWWEMKGAKIWGRTGNPFLYYNTNNNAGG